MSAFFVMLNHPNKRVVAIPMTDEDDEMAFFNSEEDARKACENNSFAQAFGYEIFELGTGSNH